MVVMALAATGCLAYRGGRLPEGGVDEAAAAVAPSDARKSIAVLIRINHSVNGKPVDLPDYIRDAWLAATLDAYRSSGLFSEVKRGSGSDTDLQAVVRIESEVIGSPAFSYLSAMSGLILPSRSRDRLSVRTIYSDGAGAVLGSYRSREVVTTWFQLLLLPAAPFASRNRVVQSTIRDLSIATNDRAHRRGIL